jgi:hypothetical protein
MTEREFPGNGDIVAFEKNFTCQVTIFYDKRARVARPKNVAFTFYAWQGGNRRLLAKTLLDVGPYFKLESPSTVMVPISPPHAPPFTARLSFHFHGSQAATPESPEILDLPTDATTSFPADSEDHDDGDESPRISLASFRSVSLATFRTRQCPSLALAVRPRRQAAEFFSGDPFVSSFTFQATAPSQDAVPLPPSLLMESPFPRTQSPSRLALQAVAKPPGPTPEFVLERFRSVLKKQWGSSPIAWTMVPMVVSALMGTFLSVDFFSPEFCELSMFESTVDTFMREYEAAHFVAEVSEFDRLLVSLSLYRILNENDRVFKERAAILCGRLIQVARRQLNAFVLPYVESLMSSCTVLLKGSTDKLDSALRLHERLDQVLGSWGLPKPMEMFCRDQLIRQFDAHLVFAVQRSPRDVTFMNAGSWNSFATICQGDYHISLPLFSQASQVVLCGPVLCASPEEKANLVPLLPPMIVLQLLAMQRPDEAAPIRNDPAKFAQHFSLTTCRPTEIRTPYRGSFAEVLPVLPTEWTARRFDRQDLDGFYFLKNYVLSKD